MKKSKLLLLLFIPLLHACNTDDDAPDTSQKSAAIDKHGSIEVRLSQTHLDSFTIVKTEKTFYDNQGNLNTSRVSFDTIPLLPIVKDTLDTGRTYDDANGDEQELDTVISHRKNYQFYITLK